VVEEHGNRADLVLKAPSDPALQWKFASVPHRQGWGLAHTSVSPDGTKLAYAVLPPSGQNPDTDAEVWEITFPGLKARRLATNADLESDLVWSPDSAWVSYERVLGQTIQVRRANASGDGDQQLAQSGLQDRWFLMGYEPDGDVAVLAHLTPQDATEIVREKPGGAPDDAAPVSALPSRSFTVLPDGRPALLALQDEKGTRVYRAVVQEQDGSVRRLVDGDAEDTGAVQGRTGPIYVGVVPGSGTTPQPAEPNVHVLLPPSGFDVPVATAPDGTFVAVRHFTGSSTDQPGTESILIEGADGARIPVGGDGPLDVAGWAVPFARGK